MRTSGSESDADSHSGKSAAEPRGTRHSSIGMVKWSKTDKGYGAISVDALAPDDVWFHFTVVATNGYVTSESGEQIAAVRAGDGSIRVFGNEPWHGTFLSKDPTVLSPGERVEVHFRRENQESFKYIAEWVRRV